MRTSEVAPTATAVILVVLLIGFVLVMRILEKPLLGPMSASPESATGTGTTTTTATTSPQSQPAPSRSSAFEPYWYPTPRGWALRDLWNRDPVCHGDPVCRDAYFRDWPPARRPFHRYPSGDSRAPQPITITVTAPSTSTSTSTSYPAPSTATTSEPTATTAGGAVGEVESQDEPAPVYVVEAESSAPLAEEATIVSSGKKATIIKAGGSGKHASRCGLGLYSSCGSGSSNMSEVDVFPATMDRGAYTI